MTVHIKRFALFPTKILDFQPYASPNTYLLLSPGWLLHAPAHPPVFARSGWLLSDFNSAFR